MVLSVSYWLSPCLSLALYGSLWLPLWLPLALTATLWLTLAFSGPLLPFNFAYIVLDRLSGPLLGSQRRCHADSLCSGLAIDDYEGNLLGGLIYIFVFFVICSKKKEHWFSDEIKINTSGSAQIIANTVWGILRSGNFVTIFRITILIQNTIWCFFYFRGMESFSQLVYSTMEFGDVVQVIHF